MLTDITYERHISAGLGSSCCSSHRGSFKKGPAMEESTLGMEESISQYLSDLSCSQVY